MPAMNYNLELVEPNSYYLYPRKRKDARGQSVETCAPLYLNNVERFCIFHYFQLLQNELLIFNNLKQKYILVVVLIWNRCSRMCVI